MSIFTLDHTDTYDISMTFTYIDEMNKTIFTNHYTVHAREKFVMGVAMGVTLLS